LIKTESQMNALHIEAKLLDQYDGLLRLIGDFQRLGVQLSSMTWEMGVDGGSASLVVTSAPDAGTGNLLDRLARHPRVLEVAVK
jgi:hypothetical protein